jgi:glucose-1-phosphate thymidylyltransferase
MKGIVLAGGTGSRLWPSTSVVSKQLLPVYDKPMIFYPLSTLMLAGIREILIITTPRDVDIYRDLLGDGKNLGVNFQYQVQPKPEGLAQSLLIAEDFLQGDSCVLILGDNIFHGSNLGKDLRNIIPTSGAHIFLYEVSNPNEYGVLVLDQADKPISISEKPEKFLSNLAVTGLYFFDERASTFARDLVPSSRGELEITSLIEKYLQLDDLSFTKLSRGTAWLDTGNANSLNDASNFIRVIEERTGLKIACLEEISFQNGWIEKVQLEKIIQNYRQSPYGRYLEKLLPQR